MIEHDLAGIEKRLDVLIQLLEDDLPVEIEVYVATSPPLPKGVKPWRYPGMTPDRMLVSIRPSAIVAMTPVEPGTIIRLADGTVYHAAGRGPSLKDQLRILRFG